ncbi:hypothetical protein TWF173_000863 [Orbilia oligospora]|nr:hypothetical protein TWF173_000863 [Orbilia oligospora]
MSCVGDLDINVYSYRPRASHDRGLAKRLDFKLGFSRDIYFNDRQIKEIPLFKFPPDAGVPKSDIEVAGSVELTCVECQTASVRMFTSLQRTRNRHQEGAFTAGAKVESTLNTEFNFGFANVLAFDPSTIKGPEVNVGAYLKDAKVKPHFGIELLVPKFQYEIEAGYSKEQFCDGFEDMTKDNKAALNNNLANQAPNKTVEIDNIKELGVR